MAVPLLVAAVAAVVVAAVVLQMIVADLMVDHSQYLTIQNDKQTGFF